MSVGAALRTAFGDFYRQSWRLFFLNTALSGFVVALLLVGARVPVALVLLLFAGPLAAALMHCAVTLAQTEDLRLGEAITGLRLHWRRGLALGVVGLAVVSAGLTGLVEYGRAGGWALPFALLTLYVLAAFALLQLALWPLAVFERERKLTAVVRDAAGALLRRPAGFAALGLVLALVNLAGAAAALAPLLTLTIAYSALAAAHFTLPRSPIREARTDG
jgi:hypothetical protein